jgi:hypothetical protein
VELPNGLLQVRSVPEFHEAEASGMARYPIAHYLSDSDIVAVLFKPLAKFSLGACVGYVSDKQSKHKVVLSCALRAG